MSRRCENIYRIKWDKRIYFIHPEWWRWKSACLIIIGILQLHWKRWSIKHSDQINWDFHWQPGNTFDVTRSHSSLDLTEHISQCIDETRPSAMMETDFLNRAGDLWAPMSWPLCSSLASCPVHTSTAGFTAAVSLCPLIAFLTCAVWLSEQHPSHGGHEPQAALCTEGRVVRTSRCGLTGRWTRRIMLLLISRWE